jgi:Ca2+-binding EF-hand superfamily protein
MKFAKTLVIGVSSFALAMSSALAADTKKDAKKDNDPGFNKLDKNNDGYLSRTEASKNPYLVKHFKEADKNGDGKLSRTEYLTVMTKKDLSSVKNKVAGNKDKDRSAATGSSKSK